MSDPALLVALDPGVKSPGVAVYRDGVLVHAAHVTGLPAPGEYPEGHRWVVIASAIQKHLYDRRYCQIDRLIFECPQIYRATKSKGDPNNLIKLAGVAAALAGKLDSAGGFNFEILSPQPADWIGQVSKVCAACSGKHTKKRPCAVCEGSAWRTPRGQRIRSRLTPAELAVIPDQHDAIDSVGLGLHALGRLGVRRVYSNGRDS